MSVTDLRRRRVRGATIVDGTGAPGRTGDLLIEDGRFAVDDGGFSLAPMAAEHEEYIARMPARVERVLVNGVPVMVAGEKTGQLGGRVLRSGRDTRTATNSGVLSAGGQG
jgi:N-acyl-D-aspartate/D-glutamate deacylase